MTGSYLLYNDLHYNGLMTDLAWNTSGGYKRTFSSRVRVRAPSLAILYFLLSQPSQESFATAQKQGRMVPAVWCRLAKILGGSRRFYGVNC